MCNFLYDQCGTAKNDLREPYKNAQTPSTLWKLDTPLWIAIEMFVLSSEGKKKSRCLYFVSINQSIYKRNELK